MQEIVPALARPASRLGDLWALGPHRIVCGDATDPVTVSLALGGAKPNLMTTDPPYGVGYDPAWRAKLQAPGSALAVGAVTNDDRVDWHEAWALFPGDVAYVWHAALHTSSVQDGLEAAGFRVRSQIIWAKQHFSISRGHYHWMHEPCWYAVRKGRTAGWAGDRKQRTVWPIASAKGHLKVDDGPTGHATQKPVACMRRPIENHTRPGDAVYDPFLGSGTTVIAAEMADRVCIGIELEPAYVDMAVARWARFTGQTATRLLRMEP